MNSSGLKWLTACALTLGFVVGLVGCAGAYPVGPSGTLPSGFGTPGVNMPEVTMPPGSGLLPYPSDQRSFAGNSPGGSVAGSVSGGAAGVGNSSMGTSSGSGISNSLTPNVAFPEPQPKMSPGIIGFFPPEGAQVCPTPKVAVAVHLTDAMRTNGAFDPSKVELTLDGHDILSEVQLFGPMIYPQSQVTLAYVQQTALTLGGHQMKFVYPGTAGPITLTWNFIVANIACG